ncbi:cadherin-like domain-containing protein [Undibacterium seohonense]|uniref:Cadherin-like domain-containing protein n=1 Tax=Undibacterium seohonense TaxID=1344950 RepID=A0ABR6X2E8_9BURK|nr:cadherin-like domain-containing protein [Undibacterium seohonense]MBC3806519.1 cadherin-like domain-containing protein [Undibacterium seohonense]
MANAAPTTSNSTHNTNEDTRYVLSASDFNFVDSDGGDTLQAVQITVPPTIGTLRLKGVNVANDQLISIADINAGYLVFTPAADASGIGHSTFQFKVSDGLALSASAATFNLNVLGVNDAPTFNLGSGSFVAAFNDNVNDSKDLALQADGKILLCGTSWSGSIYDFSIMRVNVDGTLDTSFSEDGKVNVAMGIQYGTTYPSVAVQADGKILLAGTSQSGGKLAFALVRFNSDGSLDSTFGTDGELTTTVGVGRYSNVPDVAESVALQADGKILVGGAADTDFALVRYNSSGSLDTTFDIDGKVTTHLADWDFTRSIIVQIDGKILLAGQSQIGGNNVFALVRYNSNGSLDTTFDTDGKVTVAIGDRDVAYSVTVQTDGKILLGGVSKNGNGNDNFTLVRFNSDGGLDTTFGTGGKVVTHLGHYGQGFSIAMQEDGKILLSGTSGGDFALLRYNSNGSLDTTFDTDGTVITDLGGYEEGSSVMVQADGKILQGGGGWFSLVRYNRDGSLDTTFNTDNTLDATPTYTNNGSAVVLDNNVQITDQELNATNYAGSSITLARNGGANPQDVFAGSGSLQLSGGRVIVGAIDIGSFTNVGGNLSLAFNASATQTLVNAALQQITYANTNNASGSAEIIWRFNDGSGAGNAMVQGSTVVTLVSSNVAPTVDGSQAGQTATNVQRIQPFKTISVTDPDVGALETATITLDNPLKGSFTANSMALAGFYTNDGGVSYVHDAVSPVAMQAAIRALVFEPNPSRLALNTSETTTFTITVQDQHGGTAINSTTTVITSSVNTAPTNILLSDAFVAQSEGGNATVGLLSATDNNVGDTHSFALTAATAGNDNAKFSIVGNSLKVIDPRSMTEKDYYVMVQATDANGLSFTKKLTISLDDDMAPFISSIETLRSPRPTVTTGSYIVKFNENVTGVTLDDFFLSSGSGATAHLSSITALSGSAYRVYIDQIVGTGSLNLNLKTSGTGIADLFGNSLPGSIPPVPPATPIALASNDMLVGIHLQQDVFM